MTQPQAQPSASNPAKPHDWQSSRGESWRAHLPRLEAMLSEVDEPLFRALQLDRAYRIAEVGCGGGGTTLSIKRRAPAGSSIVGHDISPALIEAASQRLQPEDTAIAFKRADMASEPPPAEPYDRLFSRFGIMFFEDELAAFSNLAQWLAPGGRFAFAAWARPANNPWMTIVGDTVADIIPMPPPVPDAPGPFRYANAASFSALLERAGFADIELHDWRGTLPLGGGLPAAEAAHFALSAFSSLSNLLAEAGDDARERAQQTLTASLASHQREGIVRMNACVHILTGTRH